jgi:hypothetical protein
MKKYTIEEKHILIFALNHSIADGEHSRQILTDPNTGYFSRVMLHFLYCCSEMVQLDFNYSRTTEN